MQTYANHVANPEAFDNLMPCSLPALWVMACLMVQNPSGLVAWNWNVVDQNSVFMAR